MQEVSYGRIMREINLTGNLAYTQPPHVSTCMEPVYSRHAISLYSTLWLTDSLSVELGFRIP